MTEQKPKVMYGVVPFGGTLELPYFLTRPITRTEKGIPVPYTLIKEDHFTADQVHEIVLLGGEVYDQAEKVHAWLESGL